MIRLSQQQMAVLVAAAAQPEGFATRPADMRPSLAAKIAGKLIDNGLVRELHNKGDAPVWREDETGKRFSLKLLKAGRALVTASAGHVITAASQGKLGREVAGSEQIGSSAAASSNASEPANKGPTKRTLILGLMGRDSGATLDQLIAATGWLPHTTRAALTGLRKSGFLVERSREEQGGASVYKIAPAPAAEAA